MPDVRLFRRAALPDPLRLARYAKVPELGPGILFFSGGTAIRDLSRRLVRYTHRSVHLITPFDSGGSSAELRRAFRMPAVGDLRNRIMALADRSVRGQPQVFELFAFRFPRDRESSELRGWLDGMIVGDDPLVAAVAHPMRNIIRSHLRFFRDAMPGDFDLRGANVGNLILCGGYLTQGRDLDPVLFLFSRLVEARGTVRAVAGEDLHLAAELDDGSVVVGQHLLTGKETNPITSPIRALSLSRAIDGLEPAHVEATAEVLDLVREAELICFPMGSFWTSLMASLLPRGIERAITEADVPKVYVPNAEGDTEQLGMTLADAVRALLERMGAESEPRRALDFVMLDRRSPRWVDAEVREVESLGVAVLDVPLMPHEGARRWDGELLARSLVSLV